MDVIFNGLRAGSIAILRRRCITMSSVSGEFSCCQSHQSRQGPWDIAHVVPEPLEGTFATHGICGQSVQACSCCSSCQESVDTSICAEVGPRPRRPSSRFQKGGRRPACRDGQKRHKHSRSRTFNNFNPWTHVLLSRSHLRRNLHVTFAALYSGEQREGVA